MLPEVRVLAQTGDIEVLYEALLSGHVDLMLAHAEWSVDLNRVEVTELYEEFSSVVAAPGHVLARRKRVGWAELANQR